MTEDDGLEGLPWDLNGMKNSQSKNRRFPHTRLGLANQILAIYDIWDSLALNLAGIFKSSLAGGSDKLFLEMEVLKGRGVGGA